MEQVGREMSRKCYWIRQDKETGLEAEVEQQSIRNSVCETDY